MDATTFMQMQQEAQAQIDALNAQIVTLTQQKNDLVNTNNTSITTAQAQAQTIIANANTQAQQIVATANSNAQGIVDSANKSKSDSDAYVASNQATIDGLNAKLKSDQSALTAAQSELSTNVASFNSMKSGIASDITTKIADVKAYMDSLLVDAQKLGS